jgi:hypothetical protein
MTLRLETAPRDDDNRWSCCKHCAHEWLSQWLAWHEEPCMFCQQEEP